MTKFKVASVPTIEELRKEEELRLHMALGNVEPGSQAYTTILAQIVSLNSHTRAIELKEIDQVQVEVKFSHETKIEDLKQQAVLSVEQKKAEAAQRQKQYDIAARLITVGVILVFESSGHSIISKAFSLIRD